MAGAERCVLCGEVIPEGRQVCRKCEYLENLKGSSRYRRHKRWRQILLTLRKGTRKRGEKR